MNRLMLIFGGLALAVGFSTGLPAQTPPQAVDVVAVVGCLKESAPDNWSLIHATEPAKSNANAPTAKELAALPRGGRNEFRLIGVSEFNLPAYKDQTVVVKGLHIKATPTSRLNMTSVTALAPSCPPPDPK